MSTQTATLQLLEIDPTTLGVRDQAREDATPDAELVASIRQHGIMQPPVVELTEDGTYVIVIGHRRIGAAIIAGISTVTVIVRATGIDNDALTLEQQIVENERRRGLTSRDLAAGYEKLTLFGLTPADIAAGLGEKPEKIRAGLKINASAAATKLVGEDPAIDFEQAAIIADFDEHPKLQKKLIETATTNPANFNRDVESMRTQREIDNRINTLKAQLDEKGIPLADLLGYEAGRWWSGKGVNAGTGRTLERLGIRPEDHSDCPGHAAMIHRAQSHYLHEQPDTWLSYVCTDWAANGHPTNVTASEKTPEEIERDAEWARRDAERDAEREKLNAERAARRAILDANTRARRTWVHGYLTTGRLRPTAAHFDVMAEALATQIDHEQWAPVHIALELLTGTPVTANYGDDSNELALSAIINDPAIPNLRVIVAIAAATFEDSIEAPHATTYLNALTAWGYALTDTDKEHLKSSGIALEQARAAAAGEDLHGDPRDNDEDD